MQFRPAALSAMPSFFGKLKRSICKLQRFVPLADLAVKPHKLVFQRKSAAPVAVGVRLPEPIFQVPFGAVVIVFSEICVELFKHAPERYRARLRLILISVGAERAYRTV